MASWLLGLGFVLIGAIRENDWKRLRPATISYTVLCILQLIALLRFHSELASGLKLWLYAAFVVSIGVLGLFGVWAAARGEIAGSARVPAT